MGRILILLYAGVSYLVFLASFLYAIGFDKRGQVSQSSTWASG